MLHELVTSTETKDIGQRGIHFGLCEALQPYLTTGIDAAERRVVRQFVEAMLFEELVPTQWLALNTQIDDQAVYDHRVQFTLSDVSFHAIATRSVFDRVRIAEGMVFYTKDGDSREAGIQAVINHLDVSTTQRQRLLSELMQTVALCRWNNANTLHHKASRRGLFYQDLEGAIVEGHLYHPCYKTRAGFSLEDHERYGPEAQNRFQLHWCAIKRSALDSTLGANDEPFWLKELGQETYEQLRLRLAKQNASWDDYSLLPVHPWQFNALRSEGLAQAIYDSEIIDLEPAGDFYRAGQSLRTLVNVSDPRKANIKLPMNVVSTSSHRNFLPHFVTTAPTISAWLQDIATNDDFLVDTGNMQLLSEYASLLYMPSNDKTQNLSGKLGVIFRESVVASLAEGEAAMPFSGLMLTEGDGKPFVGPWLDHYGTEAWLQRLLDVMVVPIWHMLVNRGVGLETHSQNLVLVHKNGWPERLVVRDFHESMEYVEAYLAEGVKPPKVAEIDPYFATVPLDEGFDMADVSALTELFTDTVYVFNLAELSFLMERFGYLDEDAFWQRCRATISAYNQSGVTCQSRIDTVAAAEPTLAVESLLARKIVSASGSGYLTHNIRNAMHPSQSKGEQS